MNVLLFDVYSGGHHLELASELAAALDERHPDVEVELLLPTPVEHGEMFFDEGDVSYLYDTSPFPDAPSALPDIAGLPVASRFLLKQLQNPRWRILQDIAAYVESGAYDLVHCLEIDKVQPYVYCHFDGVSTPLVGSINGVFYKPVESVLPGGALVRDIVERMGIPRFVRTAPPIAHRGIEWNRWFLAHCVHDGVLDHVTVPTQEARDDVLSVVGPAVENRVSVVPDPVEVPELELTQRDARQELGLPEEGVILLYFGRLCEENGVRALFRALERYEGPSFTMVFAGKPVAVTESEVETVAERATAADIEARLEFIPQADVPLYFHAADGVVLPYERSFGARRPSNVFQKACAAGRPVIVSDFGVLGRRVRERKLGLLCEPGSPESIADALRTFTERRGAVHDVESAREYAREQSFEVFAESIYDAYSRLAGRRPNDEPRAPESQ